MCFATAPSDGASAPLTAQPQPRGAPLVFGRAVERAEHARELAACPGPRPSRTRSPRGAPAPSARARAAAARAPNASRALAVEARERLGEVEHLAEQHGERVHVDRLVVPASARPRRGARGGGGGAGRAPEIAPSARSGGGPLAPSSRARPKTSGAMYRSEPVSPVSSYTSRARRADAHDAQTRGRAASRGRPRSRRRCRA